MEWKEVTLGEITNLVIDYRGKTPLKLGSSWSDSGYRALSAKNIKTGQIVAEDSIRFVDEELYRKWMKDEVNRGDILITSEAPFGQIYYWDSDEKIVLSQRLFDVRLNDEVCHKYVYYFMTSHRYQKDLEGRATGTTVTGLRQPELLKSTILLPPLSAQRSIASILSSLDRKIELNNKINADLEEMAQAVFKNWFVDFEPFKDGKFLDSELGMIPEGWKVGRADDFYQINIGKTPPRKEHKWFSTNPADKIWVSIANMGNSGIFISDSSEYLTKEAVDSHNIIMVPRNTILLSFKLTVGRVAIADKELTTNEAIARFILSDDKYMEFLYLYLKKYDYNSLGSTSSIATAVNSKTIKGMQMLQPSDNVIDAFHIQVNPIFEKIRSLAKENSRISLLRDTLLPRLMSGELEVPE
ncbi:restriction endonuclease subunit S [uncultured Prevotella sp.]|uniref:restriction endonuclease subunit S n=1 Tax=uncultured Prevotella sp. TaxID=159272 RepID=UPI002623EC94|nr:restriction endonuclease subunit S [uncultured Prevotella sp.]